MDHSLYQISNIPFSPHFCVMAQQLGVFPMTPIWNLSYSRKRYLRSISLQPFASPSTAISASLKIFKLNDMIYQEILKFVFKSINHLSPSHFHNYFQLSNMVHNHGTRQAIRGDIFQPLYGFRSIKYLGVKLWNDIPTYIKMSTSTNIFRSKLKEFIINGYDL